MRSLLFPVALVLAVGASAVSQPAEARGCLKGAAVGGVAGHYAGHHAILGAIGGCVVGHHVAAVHAREGREQAYQQDQAGRGGYAPDGGPTRY